MCINIRIREENLQTNSVRLAYCSDQNLLWHEVAVTDLVLAGQFYESQAVLNIKNCHEVRIVVTAADLATNVGQATTRCLTSKDFASRRDIKPAGNLTKSSEPITESGLTLSPSGEVKTVASDSALLLEVAYAPSQVTLRQDWVARKAPPTNQSSTPASDGILLQQGGGQVSFQMNHGSLKPNPAPNIEKGLKNTGVYVWKANTKLPGTIFLRLEVIDKAGNVCIDSLKLPISQPQSPRGRIHGIRPVLNPS